MNLERPEGERMLPLVEEYAHVSKHTVESGRVQVSTRLEERQALIHEALRHEDAMIERVQIGQEVDRIPAIRQEGEVLVYPIVEEVLFVEKRLVLKEELRISRTVRIEQVDREVTLRSVHADVLRTPAEPIPSTPSIT